VYLTITSGDVFLRTFMKICGTYIPGCGVVFMALCMGIFSGCMLNTVTQSQDEDVVGKQGTSGLSASSILNARGSRDRCDIVYPQMYEKAKNVFSSMIASYNETFGELPEGASPMTYNSLDFSNGQNQAIKNMMDSSSVTDKRARNILVNSYQMLLNITRHPDRPVDPVGFFSVVKDFESSIEVDSWGKNDFGFSTLNCCDGYPCRPIPCYGYFQVSLDIEPNWNFNAVCGKNGLNIIGIEGGPDFCASQFWWTEVGGAQKCQQMNSRGANPCTSTSYTWSPDTFAYAWADAYIQANQWGAGPYITANYPNGIKDSWKKMYTGLHFNGMFHLGYEHCAVEHYLKTYKGVDKDWQMPSSFNARKYIRSAVRRFLYEINVVPIWGSADWSPDLAKPGKDYPLLKDGVPID